MSRAIVAREGARSLAVFVLAWSLAILVPTAAHSATNYTVLGWNNLGLHCMDADYSVFSILPPYNTVNAQLIDQNGFLVTNPAGVTLTYQAVADPSGSINTTSIGKSDFWQFVLPLFGVSLPLDVGLPVPGPGSFAMPGTNNIPQAMLFETNATWFSAYGVPITPYDDTLTKNPYPMMRLVATTGSNSLGRLDVVLPVSDEMDCRACHASGSGDAAKPTSGWVNVSNPQLDYRLNILLLHDEQQGTDAVFQAALATNQFNAAGLYATATVNSNPVLCASCHLSEALPGSGLAGIEPLTEAVHGLHANVTDPTNGLTLDASSNSSACYRCHPGSVTRWLRGAMGNAVAADGSMLMQCQSCHGSMSDVGAATRTGWLQEPNCQACHSGTASSNSGQIRYTSVFDSPGHMRVPADATFATNPDTPAPGLSLYRFSSGHGGLYCEACHGSTHAEFPSSQDNDNVQSIQNQGHVGMFVECDSCHGIQPNSINGGPHGLHALGQWWVDHHHDAVDSPSVGPEQCQACHGTDYRGTVLSRSQANRTISAFGTKNFWRGFQIGCYTCHNGPGQGTANKNHPPVVTDTSAFTPTNTPVAIMLSAKDADGNALTLRVVSQARHGTVGLTGTAATYYPETGYAGGDSFTFAAWDGQTDSNLGTVQITVGGSGCVFTIAPMTTTVGALGGKGTVKVAASCAWTAASNVGWITITSGASGIGNGSVKYTVSPNASALGRAGTVTIAGQAFTVTQAGSSVDLTGSWVNLAQTCSGSNVVLKCSLRGQLAVQNASPVSTPKFGVALFLSNDGTLDPSDSFLRWYNVKKLNAGQSVTINVSIKLPRGTSASGEFVIALVDAGEATADVDNTNNILVFGPIP